MTDKGSKRPLDAGPDKVADGSSTGPLSTLAGQIETFEKGPQAVPDAKVRSNRSCVVVLMLKQL
jgi:hypothetical protein